MSRTDGRKLVGIAVALTVTALGVGTIYLPFVADRDKLRGLFEEGDSAVPEGARRQMKAMAKAEVEEAERKQRRSLEQQQQNAQQEGRQSSLEEVPQQQRQRASAGSMWSSFRRNS
jgi:hypothetical protein